MPPKVIGRDREDEMDARPEKTPSRLADISELRPDAALSE
jgi:hypothetical protein